MWGNTWSLFSNFFFFQLWTRLLDHNLFFCTLSSVRVFKKCSTERKISCMMDLKVSSDVHWIQCLSLWVLKVFCFFFFSANIRYPWRIDGWMPIHDDNLKFSNFGFHLSNSLPLGKQMWFKVYGEYACLQIFWVHLKPKINKM